MSESSSACPHERPKVTIGLPVYNGQAYLFAAISSIVSQTFRDFELIVSDNASTDRSVAIVRDFMRDDSRIRLLRSDANKGAAWNYNRVFAQAKGTYFKWAAHDDVLRPRFLECCIRAMESDSECVLAYPETVFIDADGQVMSKPFIGLHLDEAEPWRRLAHLFARMTLADPVFGLIRAETLRSTRLIDVFPAADQVLLSELAMRGKFFEVAEPLFLRRVHANMSTKLSKSTPELLAWYCTSPARSIYFRDAHVFWEVARSIAKSDLSFLDRIRSILLIRRWVMRKLRVSVGRYRRKIIARLTIHHSKPGSGA